MQQLMTKLRMYGWRKTLWFGIYETMLLWNRQFLHSYSQNKEDLVIDKLLNHRPEGFYVDVGAFDPNRFSNTKRFYERGWRGINIEPDPQNYQKFVAARPEDTNLNLGVSDRAGTLTSYKMIPGTLSTLSKQEAESAIKEGFELEAKVKVKTATLGEVMRKYVGKRRVDFLSVDTEGLDLIVLKSNDWKKFRPLVICVESNKGDELENSVDKLLRTQGYKQVFNNGLNSIYMVKDLVKGQKAI